MADTRAPGRSPWAGALVGVAVVAGLSGLLMPVRDDLGLATPALLFVLTVAGVGVVAGVRPAVATAVVATLAGDLVFVPPYGTLRVAAGGDGVALGAFVVVAVAVGWVAAAERERRRRAEAERADLARRYQEAVEAAADRDQLLGDANRAQVLERMDVERSALLRSVSHDLRTPLATIRAVASDLRDGVVYDDAVRTELLATVCDEAERLDRIVANLLSMSRIEAGAFKPDRQAVDIEELVDERVRRMRSLFRNVRVQVEMPRDLPLVDGDYSQLDQVFTNLLENAARHAPLGSFVRVSGRRRSGDVQIRVADEGIGVADWERSKVFEPFRRGEGSGSSGVGLAICKAVVEAHGGTVTVERTPGGGATFVVTLPTRR
jgi:two-component system sensor histidine kinase KdpD